MLCHQAEERMQEHLEQALSGRERMALATHLLDCSACRRRFDELEQLHTFALQLPMLSPDPSLTQDIMRQVQGRPSTIARQRHGGIAALIPIILGLGYIGFIGWTRVASPYFMTLGLGGLLESPKILVGSWFSQVTTIHLPWLWPILLLLASGTLFWNHRMMSIKPEKRHD